MKRKILNGVEARLLSSDNGVSCFELKDGSMLKIYMPNLITRAKFAGINLEDKIMNAKEILGSPEVIVPSHGAFNSKCDFCGYVSPRVKGVNYRDDKTKYSLEEFARIHSNIEDVLKKNSNIVFPRLSSNVFVDSDGNVQIRNYDEIQVDNFRAFLGPDFLSREHTLCNSKYLTDDSFYTKELDMKSSIYLYFLKVFNVSLNIVGMVNPNTGNVITLDDIFSSINLNDDEICQKVWSIFQSDFPNQYLGDDVFRLAYKYNLEESNNCLGDIRRLSKKR